MKVHEYKGKDITLATHLFATAAANAWASSPISWPIPARNLGRLPQSSFHSLRITNKLKVSYLTSCDTLAQPSSRCS